MAKNNTTARPMVTVENVNTPGYSHRVDGIKYDAVKAALLTMLPQQAPGMTQAEMSHAILRCLPEEEFPGGAKVMWWVKCVQLDLEAKGIIQRNRTSKPLRWHRLK